MKTNLFNGKYHGPSGPGGWRCSCCFPPPGKRKSLMRKHKREMYAMLGKLEDS